MLGVSFMKADPTTYVFHYVGGKVRREGAGLSFFYYTPSSTVVAVPVGSHDVPFVFNETTADFQTVTIQGTISYRVSEPARLVTMLDFSVTSGGHYRSDDPEKLEERIAQAAQVLARTAAGRMSLRQVLVAADEVSAEVLVGLRASELARTHGVEVLGVAVLSVRPTPETARALEAEAREALLRRADEAIYARRNAAVEQERTIRESELNTEIAVEEKRRQIRETQMAADVALEQQRGALVDLRAENDRKDADSRAYALEATLAPLQGADWKTLMAVGAGGADPKLMVALAFRELAENAGKIGELNVSPDLLRELVERR
jgi:hypothetical protein